MPATFRVRNFIHAVYVDHKRTKQEHKAGHAPAPAQPSLVDRLELSRQVLVRPS